MTAPARWHCATWAELTVDQLYRILAVRQAVFVVEQTCPYQDADGRDRDAVHLWAEADDGAILAYARLFAPGARYVEACIGRVITAPEARRTGLGRALMTEAIARCAARWGPGPIRLGAQRYLERFYGDLGFVPDGEPYDEDGIPHVEMVRA